VAKRSPSPSRESIGSEVVVGGVSSREPDGRSISRGRGARPGGFGILDPLRPPSPFSRWPLAALAVWAGLLVPYSGQRIGVDRVEFEEGVDGLELHPA
jgi:hypothetical protein